MPKDNFYISTDADGNMPVLTYDGPCKTHYIQYVNNKPVRGHLPDGENTVWNYSDNEKYALTENVKNYKGDDYPVITGFKAT